MVVCVCDGNSGRVVVGSIVGGTNVLSDMYNLCIMKMKSVLMPVRHLPIAK